ncbi:LytR C-terminal domain-containing protein [Corynebacterium incognita]|uniref:LytR C-terminal domain-containing protein n=1 Tax=Corynebacterium incognita TaxID=2754725 RepID=A0A7G7CRH9_9CORY|nr:LytR C-terminal domain-containing protein [Corynebacterium incognita]QNE90195.1 LytR C-terminal domain-containing protein [Corynebacterium incognita]
MTNVNPDKPNRTSSSGSGAHAVRGSGAAGASGLPLRGFALVLLAVAVGFGLWALYSFTQGDKAGNDAINAANNSSEQAQAQDAANGSDGAPANDAAGQGDDAQGSGADGAASGANGGAKASGGADAAAAPAEAGAPEAAPGESGGASAGAGSAAAGVAGADAASVADYKLIVLNNSTVKGLAAKKADEFMDKGYKVTEVGNLADTILPETTVFFPEGDSAAESAAKTLASEVSGVARSTADELPEGVEETDGLIVVLTAQ